MENLNRTIKDVLKFLGITFIICGAIASFCVLMLLPYPYSSNYFPDPINFLLIVILSIILLSIGISLFRVSKVL